MNEWEKVISFESLYKAHRRARLGKRHKKDVILFEANLSENLWQLHYDLKYGKYSVGGYHSFMIYDPKEREIQAIGYRDRVVQHSLCDNYLTPLLERYFIYDNCACRKGRGTGLAIKRLRKFMCEHYKKNGCLGYFVKIDMKKYFNNINHDVLKSMLSGLIKQQNLKSLIFNVIDSFNYEQSKGLPMGNQSSQCFALLYLNGLDWYIKNLGVNYYVRYMDDLILIVKNKQFAEKILANVYSFVKELKIGVNKKSQLIAFKNGINFLGWNFKIIEGRLIQKLRYATKKRILIKFKHNKKNKEKSLISYKGFCEWGNANYFYQRLNNIV